MPTAQPEAPRSTDLGAQPAGSCGAARHCELFTLRNTRLRLDHTGVAPLQGRIQASSEIDEITLLYPHP